MPGPITHLAISELFFDQIGRGKDKKSFYQGCVFPDIRRFAGVRRETTHLDGSEWKEVFEPRSFLAGMRFHQMVDLAFKDFARQNNYYALFPESAYHTEGGKLFADRCLYDKVENWGKVALCFDEVCEGALEFRIPREVIDAWHRKVLAFITHKPETLGDLLSVMTDGVEVAEEVMQVADGVKDAGKARELIDRFIEEFSVSARKQLN